jgi:hypothetical protein
MPPDSAAALYSASHAASHPSTILSPMFHAASGIDFTVPGSGPPDSVPLRGMVSPGEHVSLTPAGVAKSHPANTYVDNRINLNVNVITADKRTFINSEAQIADSIGRAVYAAGMRR